MKLHNQGRRGAFIDIGANQGQMILNLLALDLISSYVGFEPDPIAAAYVQELIRVNRLTNYYILPIALGNENKNCILYRNHAGDDTATVGVDVYPSDRFTESILVPVSTADDQLKGLGHQIFLVKIDTEGWELQVLNGMEITLRDTRPPVYFEVMGYRHFLDGRYSREKPYAFASGEINIL